MKLSTREDIAAPIDYVFTQASDFDTFERRALREGAQITRRQPGPVALGTVWDIAAQFRGRDRQFAATLTRFDTPTGYVVTARSDGLEFVTEVNLIALAPQRTRVTMTIDIGARTLPARLLVQSLRLAKARLLQGFRSRMRSYAEQIEDGYPKIT